MSSSSSSSSDFSRPKNGYYDVFLSFRGTDTRFVFTNNLYHLLMDNEVYTFMDRDLVGKPINSLFEIIATSKIAVVVYSEGFAASDWCLRELDMILQRVKDKAMLMIPIFYKVHVGELKHLTGKTAKYLDAHIQEHGETIVHTWKNAITTLGHVSGSSYKGDSYERDFITKVIEIIKKKLEKEWEETCIPNSYKDVMEYPSIGITLEGTKECMEGLNSSSIDVHPTKPWLLLTPEAGMCIWNYESRAIERWVNVRDKYVSVPCAKFIPEKHWIVAGGDDKFIYVLDYNTSKKLKEFKAHRKRINCVAVHPSLPYVLTASNDKLIKLWNWENDWICQQTFEGHSSAVDNVSFNPRDPHSFASASHSFFKIWRINSKVAEFTSNKYFCEISCVEYFVGIGDMLYILSGDKIWHCGSKTVVQSLNVHNRIMTQEILVHPHLPIILTRDSDKKVFIWNKNTYRLLHVWKGDFGYVYSLGFIKATEELVIGCEKGLVVMKFAFPGKQSA